MAAFLTDRPLSPRTVPTVAAFPPSPGVIRRRSLDHFAAVRRIILAELALSAVLAAPAIAQSQPDASGSTPAVTANGSTSASATDAAAPAQDESSLNQNALDEITVTASKSTHAAEAAVNVPIGPNEYILNKSDWNDVLAGSNPLELIKNTPGVAYTSTDAYGLDLSDATVFIRGFHQTELGLVFEGVPLNDPSYGSVSGTTPGNIGVPDDIAAVQISPGTVRESTFSSVATGGEIRYSLATPTATPSASVSQTYGSANTLVTTFTGQTGQLGSDGPKMLLGFQRVSDDKYQAGGTQYVLRGNLKVQQDVPWGDFTLFYSGTHAEIWGYDDLSFAMIKNLGWHADYTYPNYQLTYIRDLPQNANASCGYYSCGQLSLLEPYDSGQNTTDHVGAITHNFHLSSALSGKVMLYGAINNEDIATSDPTTPSADGAPFSEKVFQPRQRRFGGTAELKYEVGQHVITTGYWQESGRAADGQYWYNEPLLGSGAASLRTVGPYNGSGAAPLKAIGPYDLYGPAFQTQNLSRFDISNHQFYLHDDYTPMDGLSLGAGFKAINFDTTGGGIGPDLAPYGTLDAKNWFLPHVSAFWRPDGQTDVFADLAETESGYRVAPRGDIGYTASLWTVSTQQEFDSVARNIRPEHDWNLTIGTAHRFGEISLSVDGYYSLISNRLLSATVNNLFEIVNTVGDVDRSHIVGADVGFTALLGNYFRFYQSAGLSKFSYDDNLVVEGTVYPIRGNAQPGYPEYTSVSDLSFKYHSIEAGINSTEYFRQPFSYENDIYGYNYWLVTANATYDIAKSGNRPDIKVRVDVHNLLNRNQVGTIGVCGYPFHGDYQTMNRSAPRQLFLTVTGRY
jgi:iron complex outermembrane receptor protein